MIKRMLGIWAFVWAQTLAPMASAADLAVVISNVDYNDLPVRAAHADVRNLRPALQRAGFQYVEIVNLRAQNLSDRMPRIGERMMQADRVIVVLAGHFATMRGRSFLVTVDRADRSSFNIGRFGLALDAILNVLRTKQGNALLAIASTSGEPEIGWRLEPGYHLGGLPQGVTVVTGQPRQITQFLPEMLVPGRPMLEVARAAPDGLRVMGYIPVSRAFIEQSAPPSADPNAERNAWRRAVDADTVAAYRIYLVAYPNGRFAAEARARIDDLSLSPQDRARIDEEALNLNRDRRARLQQYLTILGFDTRGIDGVFGPRTRNAITSWQQSLGIPATGFLSANQVARIERDGARRAEELRREAEQRKREQEARDREYWQQTGAGASEQGLIAYLQRFPNGLFAAEANARLKQIERDKRRQARLEERLAWDDAVIQGTIASYQAYLNAYPNGTFSAEARARINALSQPQIPPSVLQQARAAEDALGLDPFRRRLVEAQLDRLGLAPGSVDGNFTNETRQAIARYQTLNNQQATGYVTRDVLVLLLVSALGR
ncbi:MAG: peptidoglycan-binding protein [Pseudomonadota bacterium]